MKKSKHAAEPPQEAPAAIDLHGLTVYDAEERLFLFLNELPEETRLVEVTHGYSHGTALKRMVQQDFHHWRIADKRVGLNPGVTRLLLK